MSRIEINGKRYEILETPEINPATGKTEAQYAPITVSSPDGITGLDIQTHDRPFEDEVFLKVAGKYGIARFAASTDFPKLPPHAEMIFVDDKNQQWGGTVEYINDESEDAQYKASLTIDFGYNTNGNWTPVSRGSEDLTKIRRFVAKSLAIQDGVISADDYEGFEYAMNGVLMSLGNKSSLVIGPEIEFDEHKEFTIRFKISPQAKKIEPEIRYASPSGVDMPQLIKTQLSEEIGACFKEPASYNNLVKGLAKVRKEFGKKDSSYLVQVWDQSMGGESPLTPVFKPDGTLVIPVNVKPNFKSMTVHIQKCNNNGDPIDEFSVNPASLGIKLHYPLNEKNLARNAKLIEDYYADQRYVVQPGTKQFATEANSAPMVIRIIPAPQEQDITFVRNVGPELDKAVKMFDDPQHDYITNAAIKKGSEELTAWYRDKGYILESDLQMTFKEGRLTVTCEALKLDSFQIVGNDPETRKWLEEGMREEILKEFPTKKGDYINANDFQEALAQIKARFPLNINYAGPSTDPSTSQIITNADGETVMVLNLSLIGNHELKWEVGAENTGMKASVGYTHTSDNGVIFSGGPKVSGVPSYTEFGANATLAKPWFNDSGATADGHGGVSWLPWFNDYNSQSVGVGMAQPIGNPNSPWSFIYGIDFERIASEIQKPDFWLKPGAGIRYSKNGWIFEIKAGPRVSINGHVYAELSIKVSKKQYLGKKKMVYLKAQAEAVLRAGHNPQDITSLSMTNLGPFQAYFKAKMGILCHLFPLNKRQGNPMGELAIGLGVGFTTHSMISGVPEGIAGIMIEGPIEVLGGVAVNPVLGVTGSVM